VLQQEIELIRVLTQDLQHEQEPLLVLPTRDLQLEVEQFHVLPIPDQQEAIQHHAPQERDLQTVQVDLRQPQDQIDLRHVQAHLLQQEQDQPQHQEVVEVAEALQEEEIIRGNKTYTQP
jgi:hypothetical protein